MEMGTSAPASTRLLRSRRVWAGFFGSCVVLFALDHAQDLSDSVLNAGAIYQRILTIGFKPLYPRNTVIVEIRNRREPADATVVNVCQQRLFLSRLLKVLGDPTVAPTALVLDKDFSWDACLSINACSPSASCDGTPILQETVKTLLNQNVTIIVGRQFEYQAVREPPLKLLPSLAFPVSATGRRVIEGSLNLDDDNRRAALVWTGRGEDDQSVQSLETIGLRAALSRDPRLMEVNTRLNDFYRDPHGPFVGFLPSRAFHDYTFSAIEVLCGAGSGPSTDWRTCDSPNREVLARMKGRVVLIGENYTGVDQHETVVGTLAGVYLWANYVEAILDDNLFRQVPMSVTYIFGFMVFALIEFASWKLSGLRKAIAIAGLVIGSLVVCYLVVRLTGYYLSPAVGILGAVLSQVGESATSRLAPHRP